MIEILQNKNSSTRFQIMVEIASEGPNIHQRNIADRLNISPQAVSEYIKQLSKEKLVISTDRCAYKVTIEGVNWMIRMLRELNDFISETTLAVKNITTCAAIAENKLKQGQQVGLMMKDGLLYATTRLSQARGIVVTDANTGEDVGVSNIEGLVELTRGKITVLQVPTVQDGGSRRVDLPRLKSHLVKKQNVGAIGIEAMATLRRIGIEPLYLFGVAEAAIEQAKCGLSFNLVCTCDSVPDLIKKLSEHNLDYEIVNLLLKGGESLI